MNLNRVWPTIGALFLLFATSVAFAQGNSDNAPGHVYGLGQPHSINELPPGQFKSTLEELSPKARGKALSWLQRFSFPAEDVAHIRVDSEGSIFYTDAVPQDTKDSSFLKVEAKDSIDDADAVASATQAVSLPQATTADSPAADPQTVFKLHSRPGSSNVIFLDFDGHTLQNTTWNDMLGQSVLEALPYDPSVNDNPKTVANFTQIELDRIAEIWHRMASDFVAFDIDITTEEPSVFTDTTGRIVVTDDADAAGRTMPYPSIGGAAHVDVFGLSNYGADYPALVYYTNLWSYFLGEPGAVAEAASHQFGHQLGLSHDGVAAGTDFYQGSGVGMVKWAPIMGSPYKKNVTQWSQGEYWGASNPEDDLAIIAGHLGFIADDHADLPSQASAVAVDEDGTIVASSPELDPDNILTENKGVIGNRDDVDWFYVDVTGSGALEITATPSWHSFTRNDERGTNLDIELSLFNSSLTLVAVDEPDDETNATVTATVNPGRYYLQLDGVGNSTRSDYSDYASIGMYFIEGSVPMDGAPTDTTPPSPAQMAWQSPPNATSSSSISMTAVTATDDSGSVEYFFTCVSGGPGCSSSGWQANPAYTDSGLQADTSYSYKVTARDAAGNTNNASVTSSATTDNPGEDTIPPSPTRMSWQTPPHATSTSSISMTAITATDASGSVEYFFTCASGGPGCSHSGWQASSAYTDSGLQADTSYSYKVTARDAAGNTNNASVTASATTNNAGGDTIPPSPAQMSWQTPPHATGTSTISMTAVTATDDSGSVEYAFTCVSGGPGCSNSGWRTSPTWTDSGLQANTTYSYRVQARDAAGNTNNASSTASATTNAAADTTPPSPATMSWQTSPHATGTSTISMTAVTATDASGSVEYTFTCVSGGTGCSNSGWQANSAYTDSGLQANTTYSYRVQARDAAGNTNNISATASATTDGASNNQPTAVASYSPNPAQITKGKSLQVTLNGAGSYDTDGSITAWSWRNSSGSVVSTNSSFSVSLREGSHSYTLTVTDNNGASGTTEVAVVIWGKNSTPDTTPPSPSQMSWQSPPNATGSSSISMTAVTATDNSGGVEYYFTCVSGGTGCNNSGWQSSRTYTDNGLQGSTAYSYSVRARDAAGNMNTGSAAASATTDGAVDTTPPSPTTMSWQTSPHATGTSSISMTAVTATDASGSVQYNFTCVSGGPGCSNSGWRTSRTWTDSGLQADTTYSYRVQARDAAGNTNNTSATASATTDGASNNQPTAVASYSPNPAQITKGKSLQVTLNGAGSHDTDGSITAWSWKDQSGSVVSTASNFSVRLREGSHNYTLTVTDNDGASDATPITVTVLGR